MQKRTTAIDPEQIDWRMLEDLGLSREKLEASGALEKMLSWQKSDLLPIAHGQVSLENKRIQQANEYLFCDTCLLELMVYSYLYYGKCHPQIERAALTHHYHTLFLTYVDVPWQPDDLRDKPHERESVFAFFEQHLNAHSIQYHILKGSLEERIAQCTKILTA